ncbi:MAG: type II toxin-antitoxin system HipA family toxin [Actinomycetota bacterium]
MNLDVYVCDRKVGRLSSIGDGGYAFTYLPDVPPDNFVSLTMPVQAASHVWKRGLPPVFLMNLPEGYKKDLLREQLGGQAAVTDENLLALTGHRTIGRVRVVPAGATLAEAADPINLAEMLASPNSRDLLLQSIVGGVADGVSGVMPKRLHDAPEPKEKVTSFSEHYILKTGPDYLPGLSINEYLCLEVARATGLLAVPEADLSEDGDVLAIRRFDRDEAGGFIGFEDCCALKGLDPASKYTGSLEDLAKYLKAYVLPENRQAAAQQLMTLIYVNYALSNADAHLKNFGFLYTGQADVMLAPAYDIVTVRAYEKYKDNNPGLTLNGKKVWHAGKFLHLYGSLRLNLTAHVMADIRERVNAAIRAVTPRIKEYADLHPAFRETGKRMLSLWSQGIADIEPSANARSPRNTELRDETGLSDDRPAAREANPYIDPAGAFSHKAR